MTNVTRGGWLTRRRAAVIVVALLAAFFSEAVSVEQVVGSRAPALARRWAPWSAAARAADSVAHGQPGAGETEWHTAQAEARAALNRDPTSVIAARSLGQIAALHNDLPRADRLFAYAEQLSRRDLLTELWMLEAQVRQGRVAGALVRYDRALRTNAAARPTLFPVLVLASGDPNVAPKLGGLLASRPPWGADFLAVMAESPHVPPNVLAAAVERAHLAVAVPAERAALAATIRRLADAGAYELALRVFRQAIGGTDAGLIRDGGFEREPLLPPLDWSLAGEADLSATREPAANGMGLELRAENGRTGELARQLLVLSPGAYALSLVQAGAGPDPLARAVVAIGCANREAPLLTLPLGAAQRTRSIARFTVPMQCPGQWLTIAAPDGLGDGPDRAPTVVDDVVVRRLDPGSDPTSQQTGG